MRPDYQARIDELDRLIDNTDDLLELKAIQHELDEIIHKLTVSIMTLEIKLNKIMVTNQIKQITRFN